MSTSNSNTLSERISNGILAGAMAPGIETPMTQAQLNMAAEIARLKAENAAMKTPVAATTAAAKPLNPQQLAAKAATKAAAAKAAADVAAGKITHTAAGDAYLLKLIDTMAAANDVARAKKGKPRPEGHFPSALGVAVYGHLKSVFIPANATPEQRAAGTQRVHNIMADAENRGVIITATFKTMQHVFRGDSGFVKQNRETVTVDQRTVALAAFGE